MPRIHFEYTTLAADNNYPEFEVHVVRGQQVRVRSFDQTTCKLSSSESGMPEPVSGLSFELHVQMAKGELAIGVIQLGGVQCEGTLAYVIEI